MPTTCVYMSITLDTEDIFFRCRLEWWSPSNNAVHVALDKCMVAAPAIRGNTLVTTVGNDHEYCVISLFLAVALNYFVTMLTLLQWLAHSIQRLPDETYSSIGCGNWLGKEMIENFLPPVHYLVAVLCLKLEDMVAKT